MKPPKKLSKQKAAIARYNARKEEMAAAAEKRGEINMHKVLAMKGIRK